jgi:hypothetical protein
MFQQFTGAVFLGKGRPKRRLVVVMVAVCMQWSVKVSRSRRRRSEDLGGGGKIIGTGASTSSVPANIGSYTNPRK